MIGPSKELDIFGHAPETYFDPEVAEVRENPPALFPPKTAEERRKAIARNQKRDDTIRGDSDAYYRSNAKRVMEKRELAAFKLGYVMAALDLEFK